MATARAAGATVHPAQQRDRDGYSGYFVDPDGFHWEVAFNPHPMGGGDEPHDGLGSRLRLLRGLYAVEDRVAVRAVERLEEGVREFKRFVGQSPSRYAASAAD